MIPTVQRQLQSSFSEVDFGAMHTFANTLAVYWEINRPCAGSVFIWKSPYITTQSLIKFDDKAWLPLIPQQPYFIEFRQVTVRIYNPIEVGYASFHTIQYADAFKAYVFEKPEFYFNCTNRNERFSIILSHAISSNFGFRINEFICDNFSMHIGTFDNNTISYYIFGNSANFLLTGVKPCLAFNMYELSVNYAQHVGNIQVIPNIFDYYDIDRIYFLNQTQIFTSIDFFNNAKEARNIHKLYDYHQNLAADTTYKWYYYIPRDGSKDLHFRLDASLAWQTAGLYYFLANGNVGTLQIATPAVTGYFARHADLSGDTVLRLDVKTNAGGVSDLAFQMGIKNY